MDDEYVRRESSSRSESASCGVAELLRDSGEGEAVVGASLFGKAKEYEEDESTCDGQPWLKNQVCHHAGLHQPLQGGILLETREAPVQVIETSPRIDGILSAEDDEVDGKGDSAKQFNASESHKAEVTVERQVAVRGKQFAELPSTSEENTERAHCNGG